MAGIGLFVMVCFNIWLTLIMLVISFNTLGKYNIGGIPNKNSYKFYTLLGWIFIYFIWVWVLGFVHINISMT